MGKEKLHNKKVELTGASSAVLRGKFGRPGQLTVSVVNLTHGPSRKGENMKNYWPASCLMLLSLAGCAANPRIDSLSSESRAKVSQVQILKGKPTQPFHFLGQVDGLSCNRNKYQVQDVSEAEALEGVRIKAVLLGGDAVINTLCQKNSDTDWANNCWASVKCIGDAVKLELRQ